MATKINREGQRIPVLWAFVGVDADGDEGLCAIKYPGVRHTFPLVTPDEQMLGALRAIAQETAKHLGHRVELRRFESAKTLEKLSPTVITATGLELAKR